MMEVAVLNFTKVAGSKSMQASNNLAWWLVGNMDAVLIDGKDACLPSRYDWVFLVNGPFLFCDFRDEVVALCKANTNFIWIGNDYAITIPTPLKFITERNLHYWCAYEDAGSNHHLINWNALKYDGKKSEQVPVKYDGLAYYGAYRIGRETYFREYFSSKDYPVYVSTSKKSFQKFLRLNRSLRTTPPIQSISRQMGQFQAVIYIEDLQTHRQYCHPANRFYECLSAGVPQLFDKATEGTFKRAGIGVGPYVGNSGEVHEILNDPALMRGIREEQDRLHRDYVGELKIRFEELRQGL